jgi:pantoate kinase
MADVAQASVPGHVTGFFTVSQNDDPTKAGSRGAGIALSRDVSVSVRPATEPAIILNGDPVEMDAPMRVLRALDAGTEVRGVTDLPLGAGFGVSGAMTLGTALATNALFDRALSENELLTIAHGAEVQAGTGLGDVVAQARGGVPIRLDPGGPQDNHMDGIPARSRIEYQTFGKLPTADVLDGEIDLINQAGKGALSTVVGEPTLPTLMRASREFSRESMLLTDRIQEAITDVAEAGGTAAMAMLGETVFALGTGLSDAGYNPDVCSIHTEGATLEATPETQDG